MAANGPCGVAVCSCRPRLGVGDVGRADPAQHFARGLDWRRVMARWPLSELCFELVGDPPRLVAALLRNVRERAVPSAFLDLVIADDGSAAVDEPQLAGG